jgi:hypothetical protein
VLPDALGERAAGLVRGLACVRTLVVRPSDARRKSVQAAFAARGVARLPALIDGRAYVGCAAVSAYAAAAHSKHQARSAHQELAAHAHGSPGHGLTLDHGLSRDHGHTNAHADFARYDPSPADEPDADLTDFYNSEMLGSGGRA